MGAGRTVDLQGQVLQLPESVLRDSYGYNHSLINSCYVNTHGELGLRLSLDLCGPKQERWPGNHPGISRRKVLMAGDQEPVATERRQTCSHAQKQMDRHA